MFFGKCRIFLFRKFDFFPLDDRISTERQKGRCDMKETRKIMQVVTLLYLVLVGIGLYIAAKVLPAESLLNAILPLALILIVLWFVLIFATLKWQSRKK